MKVFGITGYSGMGKTTLLERLVPELSARGVRVSLIKHSDKDIEVDRPGKDSYRLREAGCHEVLLLGRRRWALMHELRKEEEPPLDYLLSRLHACDIALVEGFKHGRFPKLEVWRAQPGKDPLSPGLEIVAVAAPRADQLRLRERQVRCRVLDLEDTQSIAAFVLAHAQPLRRAPHPLETMTG